FYLTPSLYFDFGPKGCIGPSNAIVPQHPQECTPRSHPVYDEWVLPAARPAGWGRGQVKKCWREGRRRLKLRSAKKRSMVAANGDPSYRRRRSLAQYRLYLNGRAPDVGA